MKHTRSRLRLMTILGTRPEIIRLSRTMALLDKHLDQLIVHTGQNYDYELNELFFKDLELRKPDYFLKVETKSLGSVLGQIIIRIEVLLKKTKPDAVLILGDTNSSIAGIMAKRMKIPIYHMEAGNRCFDPEVPEEINRRIIDHIADFNLVYTENARRHLISEGLPHRRIYLTGSPMYEVLMYYSKKINKSGIIRDLRIDPKSYFVVSVHREENVDNPEKLKLILSILDMIAVKYGHPIIVSTHPRTRKRLLQLNKKSNKLIKFFKPFGFCDYIHLEQHALCTISDSGTISEESAILSFPAITIRNSMERPEALDAGTIILTGLDPKTVLDAIELTINEHADQKYKNIPGEYFIDNTSWRVLKLILGTAKLSNKWHNISMTK